MRRLAPHILSLAVVGSLVSGAAPAQSTPEFREALEAYQDGDAARAVMGFRTLAEQGDGAAQFNLALLFLKGAGLPRNDRAAFYWAWRARLNTVPEAVALSDMIGRILPAEVVADVAGQLFEDLKADVAGGKADAMLGVARVQITLSPAPDRVEALAWATLASAFDVAGARALRDALGLELSDQDRLAAQARAQELFADWCAGPGAESCGH
ncbi:hypothetical protein EV663_10580 [Rhodovulum bhavnagarense]|uniref:Sel1 repeat-containing protein n=1 Tax=Rhodovulum bhavnagarense TaxID=992286 RepID=A0A4R2RD60_9RHOB|nr:sel1 repeat family protein [Rhodovulum bhavnagarense]TCP61362.1 hypothetical protein EV663_10580 [Rhodovulum bhavnagarense]